MAAKSSSTKGTDVALLMDLSKAMVALAVRSIGAIDGAVSLPQFRALAVLDQLGPCSAGTLGEGVGLHVSTITRLCDRLVKMGLITREVRPHNRRQVELALTPQGSALVQQVWAARGAELATALRALSVEQRAGLREAVPELVELLRGTGSVPGGW